MDTLVGTLQREMIDNVRDIFEKFKAEQDRYDGVIKTLVDFPKMKQELIALGKKQ